MTKSIITAILVCTLILFASCTKPVVKTEPSPGQSGGSDGGSASAASTDKMPAPADTAPAPAGTAPVPADTAPVSADTTPAPADTTESAVTVPAEPSISNASELTLESIKKAALAAGYEVEDVEDFRISGEPQPVDGFNLIFEDENMSAHTPIYEFKDQSDAMAFAEQVNEAGYSLCIVNGRFVTTTGAEYGIVSYDKHAGVMETLLQGKVMEYQEPAWVPLPPAVDYASTYLHINAIYKALDKLVNKSVILYDKTAPEDARVSTAGVWFSLISISDLSFTSALCEDQAKLDYVKQFWEMFGVTDMKITHDKAHEYILTGQRAGLDTTFEIRCSYSPDTGALRLVDTDGGEIFEFYEFVPLGGDTYAFQTLYSRAVVEFKDGKILSFVYALNKQDKELAYTPESDGIYENSGGVNKAWVAQKGADSYEQFITYDGTTLHIEAEGFFGDRLSVEIKPQ